MPSKMLNFTIACLFGKNDFKASFDMINLVFPKTTNSSFNKFCLLDVERVCESSLINFFQTPSASHAIQNGLRGIQFHP